MNNTFYGPNDYRSYLEHHGVLGMKWGVRRYQNSDGTFTNAGLKKARKTMKKDFNSKKLSLGQVMRNEKSDSLGKNTDNTVAKYKKEANASRTEKALTKMDREAQKLQNLPNNEANRKKVQDFNNEYYRLQVKNTREGEELAKKYIKELNTAYAKDLNIPNSEQVGEYVTNSKDIWDTTYINNYAWFKQLH